MSLAEKSPFKFLDSYSAEDSDIFFGREREVEEVYDKVFQSKLLLLYGASGTGKSSIINCGLANKFDDSDWFPIRIRRGGNIRRSLFNQIDKEAIQKVNLTDAEKTTNRGLQKVINSVYLDHFKPIYLIFDQFEELFIFGFKDEWQDFISAIRFLMDTDLDLHFIFVIRGEYLEFLSEFEELIPEFFDNRMRVEKMTRKKAEETIQGPANAHSITLEEGFEDRLLKKLSPDKSQIELTFLQVFLDKIYKTAPKSADGEPIAFTIDQIEKLGQLGDVLAEFVDEQLFQMEDPKAALTVLKSFVSLQGTKVQNTIGEVVTYCQNLGLTIPDEEVEKIIRSFINKRILKDYDDNEKYELRHDSLAQKIFEKITNQEKELLDVKQFLSYSLNEFRKRGTLLTDEDIGYIAFYERNLEVDQETKAFIDLSKKNSTKRLREKKRRTIIGAVILLLLVTSVFGFFYSQTQKRRAEELATIAESEKVNAEQQKTIAEQQREIAIQNEHVANEQAKIANNQRNLADKARSEANTQRNLALTQKSIAENERMEANKAREEAIKSENQALEQKAIADEQRTFALRLRTLSLAREIAIKSSYMTNKELKALLSLQAHYFNRINDGNPHDPDIYQSLYLARKEYFHSENHFKAHSSVIKDIKFRNGSTYTIGNDGKLLQVENGGINTLLELNFAFERLKFIDDNQVAIGTQNGTLILFDLNQGQVLWENKIHDNDITSIDTNENGVITASLDGSLVYSDIVNFKIVNRIDFDNKITDMKVVGNQIWLLSGSNTLISVSSDIKDEFNPVPGATLTSLEIDASSNKLYLGSQKGDIWVWNITTREIIQVLSGHSSTITALEINKNREFIASSSLDRTVRIWPLNSDYDQPLVLNDHDNWASAVAFNGSQIMTGSYSGSLKIFDLNPSSLTKGLCEKIARVLTTEEWNEFISEDIKYEAACEE